MKIISWEQGFLYITIVLAVKRLEFVSDRVLVAGVISLF
jgi:hypothetical protein